MWESKWHAKSQGKIEQTVVHPSVIQAFVIPNHTCLTRGWYCENSWLKEKRKRSLKIYLVLNCKYSYHIVPKWPVYVAIYSVSALVFYGWRERDRQKIAKNSVSRVSSFLCLFKYLEKGCFCHKPIWVLENIYLHFLFNVKTLFYDISDMCSFFSYCKPIPLLSDFVILAKLLHLSSSQFHPLKCNDK